MTREDLALQRRAERAARAMALAVKNRIFLATKVWSEEQDVCLEKFEDYCTRRLMHDRDSLVVVERAIEKGEALL